jgi:hypothetical protein
MVTNSPKTTERPTLTLDMSIEQALGLVASGKVPMEAYIEWDAVRIAKIEARGKSSGAVRFKVSAKGAVSVYGLSKQWPTTLYASQWARLLGAREQLEAFIVENKAKLSYKS